MSKRTFTVDFEGSVTIELDDKVIDAVDDEWRSQMYQLRTPEEIAEHIAFNLVINNAKLEQLDGWADQPNDHARIVAHADWDMTAHETTPTQRKMKRKKSDVAVRSK